MRAVNMQHSECKGKPEEQTISHENDCGRLGQELNVHLSGFQSALPQQDRLTPPGQYL